jgi:hypothetical protein
MPKSKGDDTEDLIETICSVIALKDFVVRNPKFKKQNGQEKELTDILVPFEDVALSIQAKSKIIDTGKSSPEVIQQRIAKIVNDGIGQLRNTRLIVDAGKTLHYKNAHGVDIPLNASIVKKIHGIVIVDVYEGDKQLNVTSGYERKHNMPIHIFSAVDFDALSTEIDTIPDIIAYLDTRTRLFDAAKINPGVNELDLLAVYKTQPQLVDEILAAKGGMLVVNEGIWEGYINDRAPEIKKRNELNKFSYLVDMTIRQLVRAIDYSPGTTNPATGEVLPPATKENYWQAIYELSKLDRLERRGFGNKMAEKLEQATKTGTGYTMLKRTDDATDAILFLSTNKSRQERTHGLYNLASMAYVRLGLRRITAIATEPKDGPGRSLDVIILNDVKFEDPDKVIKAAEKAFAPPRHIEGYEYSG